MKYNYFWICDAGIKVLPLALNDLVLKMTDNVALVHALPSTTNRKGFACALEKVCTFFLVCQTTYRIDDYLVVLIYISKT